MLFALKFRMLVVVAGVIGLLLWWSGRRIVPRDVTPWLMTGMVLVGIAMVLLILGVPAPPEEQVLRVLVLLEAGFGFWLLNRRSSDTADGDGR